MARHYFLFIITVVAERGGSVHERVPFLSVNWLTGATSSVSDVRNAQLAHDYRREEDNQQYHKENECGVGYREVTGYFGHEYIFMCKVTQKNG